MVSKVSTEEQKVSARKMREALSMYREAEDLINLGAYVSGTNPKLDQCIKARPEILSFLQQDAGMNASRDETLAHLNDVAAKLA